MRNLAFIPVRGGSKSIPLKNIKSFCGQPLIFWNLQELQNTSSVDEIIVATDNDQIEKAVESFNFSKVKVYRRLPENATDTASTESVMLEYLNKVTVSPDFVFMLVQATSPLTTRNDFQSALDIYHSKGVDSLLSCVRTKRFVWSEEGKALNYDFTKRPRRQDFNGFLMENGAFYINTVGNIIKDKCRLSGTVHVYEMPEHSLVEIDEEYDWIVAEGLMKKYFPYVMDTDKRSHSIRLVATDVDGVLTDAGMYYSENGDELKKFNTRDGKGFELLRNAGIKSAIVTSEVTRLVERRAAKLKIDYLYQGKGHHGKLNALLEICEKEHITLKEVAYIGDDLNCIEALSQVGWAACPADAVSEVKAINNIDILKQRGGEGVVREFIKKIVQS